jgi:hypothetical protein
MQHELSLRCRKPGDEYFSSGNVKFMSISMLYGLFSGLLSNPIATALSQDSCNWVRLPIAPVYVGLSPISQLGIRTRGAESPGATGGLRSVDPGGRELPVSKLCVYLVFSEFTRASHDVSQVWDAIGSPWEGLGPRLGVLAIRRESDSKQSSRDGEGIGLVSEKCSTSGDLWFVATVHFSCREYLP